jgi:hypothetical protein
MAITEISRETHDFAIKNVLLDHHHVDSLGVFECEETEAAATPGGAIPHDGAFQDLAKLRKIVTQ